MTTLKDLARHLNLSVTQVSRAFNGHSDVSLATKERVREGLDEDTLTWIGPLSGLLQTLWERLKPATFAVTASDDTGSEAAIEINGTGYLFKISRH